MKNISPQKSNSLIIDICKFIGAYMVVAIHTTPFEQTDGVISNIYFTLLKCAVPFSLCQQVICLRGVWNGRFIRRKACLWFLMH